MKIQLDIRLPLSLFRKVQFLFTAPNYKYFPMGTPIDYLTFKNENISAFLPCTLYHKKGNTITDLLFSFSFPFIDEDEHLAIYLTHPIWLEKSDFSTVHTLLDELSTCFNKTGEVGEMALYLELQRMLPSSSLPAYPTSLTHFSYDVTELFKNTLLSYDFAQFREAGLKEYRRLVCYECEIETLLNNLHLKSKQQQYKILEDFPGRNLTILLRDPTSSMIMQNYSITNSLAFISNQNATDIVDQGIASFQDEQLIGFFQWTPNLFELPVNALPTPFLYPNLLKVHPFTTGKIFRFGVKTEDDDLFKELLHKTLLQMREKGLTNCQIGYIDEQNEFLTSLLNQIGFTAIHSLQILKKEVQ